MRLKDRIFFISIVILPIPFLLFQCKSQNNNDSLSLSTIHKFFLLDNIIDTKIAFDNIENYFDRMPFAIAENKVFYIDIINNILRIYAFDLVTQKGKVVFSDENPNVLSLLETIWDLSVNKKYLTLVGHHNIAIYSFINPDSLVFYKLIELNEPFTIGILSNREVNKIYLYRCYDYKRPEKNFSKSKIGLFNIDTEVFEKVISPQFDGFLFSHFFPNKWFDISEANNTIAFSQSLEYKIDLYDLNFNYKFSIKRSPPKWKNLAFDQSFFKNNNLPAKEIIKLLKPIEKNGGSRIRKIHFLNDSTLAVFWANSSLKLNFCDLWKIKQDSANVLFSDMIDIEPDENETIEKFNFPFLCVYNDYKFKGHFAICFSLYPSSIVYSSIGENSYKGFMDKLNQYYEQNSPTFSIVIFKFEKLY